MAEYIKFDVAFLKTLFTLSKVFGVLPTEFNLKKRRRIYFYNIIIFIVYLWQIKHYIFNMNASIGKDVNDFLENCSYWFTLLFSISCLTKNTSTTVQFKNILTNISTVDSIFNNKEIVEKMPRIRVYMTVIYLVVFIISLLREICTTEGTLIDMLWWIGCCIMFYQRLVAIIIFTESVSLLERRYSYCKQYLKKIFLCDRRNKLTHINIKINNLKQVFILTLENIEQLNDIFGYQILLIIIGAFIDVLDIIAFIIDSPSQDSDVLISTVISFLVFGLLFLVSKNIGKQKRGNRIY